MDYEQRRCVVTSLSEEILRLDGVWRRYRRRLRPPRTFKEAAVRTLRGDSSAIEDFWALQDVSFSLRRGETLGVCGANGSGKSTLLKVVGNILPLSHGHITVRGRLAALLDLGTGFLPELTGRENIALNGAIMGLRDAEVKRKEESIVRFADIGTFIDSPVSTYSAGMFVRLGFSIAVHLEADLLLMDEVLAVGDAEFQDKCTDRLSEMQREGTSMLVVSHSLPLLERMCHRVIWLDRGRIRDIGEPRRVLKQYCPIFSPVFA
jgi:ABC-type polysaccharide/polyol phosphate transport system ATPase subunit